MYILLHQLKFELILHHVFDFAMKFVIIQICWSEFLLKKQPASTNRLFFCNRHNSFLSFGGRQLYNLEALPFTYDQYTVIELADNLYKSATVCFCVSPCTK